LCLSWISEPDLLCQKAVVLTFETVTPITTTTNDRDGLLAGFRRGLRELGDRPVSTSRVAVTSTQLTFGFSTMDGVEPNTARAFVHHARLQFVSAIPGLTTVSIGGGASA
jgi:hypothetical protein